MHGTKKYFAYKLLNTGSMQNKIPARLTFFLLFACIMSNNKNYNRDNKYATGFPPEKAWLFGRPPTTL